MVAVRFDTFGIMHLDGRQEYTCTPLWRMFVCMRDHRNWLTFYGAMLCPLWPSLVHIVHCGRSQQTISHSHRVFFFLFLRAPRMMAVSKQTIADDDELHIAFAYKDNLCGAQHLLGNQPAGKTVVASIHDRLGNNSQRLFHPTKIFWKKLQNEIHSKWEISFIS